MIRYLVIFFLYSTLIDAQSVSSIFLESGTEIPVLSFDKPLDVDELSQVKAEKGQIFNFAKLIPSAISSTSDGVWTTVDGGRVWTLAIEAKSAKGISLYYDDFWIPSQGKLYIYNPSQTQKIGPFTSEHNHESGVFATEVIFGDILVLEYFQPHSEDNILQLNINRIAYAYKDISGGQLSGYNSSDACQVNANCSEGDAWEKQKKSVCRIQIGSGWNVGLCSGALINNTLNNCAPYVLSADHCFDGVSINGLNQSIFYFNYRSSSCNNSVPNSTYSITGCKKLSNSGGQGDVGDPDFFLVELNSDPDFDPYFSGWDRSNVPASSGVSIHHPSGDIMKISTFTNTLISSSGLGFGNDNTTHWQVKWSSTPNGHGVTEGGSSGSPIFNQNGLIVGDLTGGSSSCAATNSSDIYGKIWHGWDQVGNSDTEQLKSWLDPVNTNAITLSGMYCNQSGIVTAAFNSTESSVCKNSTVTFSSISSGEINSYSWQFPGGSPAFADGPGPHNVAYNSIGDYDVSLTVYGADNSDIYSQNNYISVASNEVTLDFLPDCYGSETTWQLENSNGQELYSISSGYYPGGNNAVEMEENPQNVIDNWCLIDGCYSFTVEDEYGDGLYGSQHTCDFNGDFTIYNSDGNTIAELTSPNSDFGDEITVEFCVESSLPSPTWNCVNNACVDPQDGSGVYNSIDLCVDQCHLSSVSENSLFYYELYPNPTQAKFTLQSDLTGEVKVFNTFSQEVYSGFKTERNHSIDLERFNDGIYFIHFNNSIQKIIKQ